MATQKDLDDDLKVWKEELQQELKDLNEKLHELTVVPANLRNRIKHAEIAREKIEGSWNREKFKNTIIYPIKEEYQKKEAEHEELKKGIDDKIYFIKVLLDKLEHVK